MRFHAFIAVLAALHGASTTDSHLHSTILETRITTLVTSTGYISDRWFDARKARLRRIDVEGIPSNQAVGKASSTNSNSATITTSPIAETYALCWLFLHCIDFFRTMQQCFGTVGGMTNPNDESQSEAYRNCLCDPNTHSPFHFSDFKACGECFREGNLDLTVIGNYEGSVYGFCGTDKPSLYLLLFNVINFLQQAHAPSMFSALSGPITEVTTLSKSFTPIPGLNRVREASSPQPTIPFNEDLLIQLPPKWPYEKYGWARQPGQTKTWYLTNSSNGDVLGVVLASMQWYPRPLGNQKPLPVPTRTPVPTTDAATSEETIVTITAS